MKRKSRGGPLIDVFHFHQIFRQFPQESCKPSMCLSLNLQVDEANTEPDLVKLLVAVQKDSQICIDKLETSLSTNNLNEAKDHLIILRYLLSLENSIKEKANRLGINL